MLKLRFKLGYTKGKILNLNPLPESTDSVMVMVGVKCKRRFYTPCEVDIFITVFPGRFFSICVKYFIGSRGISVKNQGKNLEDFLQL